MIDCGIKHTQEEEQRLIENSLWADELLNRYYQHDRLACKTCVDNSYKLKQIIGFIK